MSSLLREYKHQFSDTPGRTDAIYHDIELTTNDPIT